MRPEASLRRLEEMGIAVHVLRRPSTPAPAPARSPSAAPASTTLLLMAEAATPGATRLLADIVRSMAFAPVACRFGATADAAMLAAADALVFLGGARARAAGALVPVDRQQAAGWFTAGEADSLVGDAPARRVLWKGLRPMLRGLAAAQHDARG
jgi:DNA polymerase III psi subunit